MYPKCQVEAVEGLLQSLSASKDDEIIWIQSIKSKPLKDYSSP